MRRNDRRFFVLAALGLATTIGCSDEGQPDLVPVDAAVVAPRLDRGLFPDVGVFDAAVEEPEHTFSTEATVFTLTVLHTNDGRSELLSDDEHGGVARFITRLKDLQRETPDTQGQLTLSTGDNVLAGPVYGASLLNGRPFYDAVALGQGGYDAMTLGNHDFDFGPEVLADFINSFDPPVRFLSANLDFAPEPALAELVTADRLSAWTIVRTGDADVGLIGLTTDTLAQRSSPGDVGIGPVVAAAQTAIEEVRARGVDKIVLMSHLTSLNAELALLAELTDVDVMLAGGSDDLLANAGDGLLPDALAVEAYPVIALDAGGRPVPVVTTPGGYEYIGRLTLGFDLQGRVTSVLNPSGPVRVVGGERYEDAVEADPVVVTQVETPVRAALAALDAEQLGFSQVPLHGRRRDLRRRETNLGNLVADALLWQAGDFVFGTDLPVPDVALMNGGGIRNNSILPPGRISELDTYEILPFASFVTLVTDVERATLKGLLENAVSQVDNGAGRFAQVAGLSFTWDPNGEPRSLDVLGAVAVAGSRVTRVVLHDGTVVVEDGEVVGGPALTVATIDFLARGGDGFAFEGAAVATGISYQTALRNFVAGALEGEVDGDRYPVGGVGRVVEVE
jgi:5'-nucleotidase / UDP-sugar diphosphatase